MKLHEECFTGSEAVTWLRHYLQSSGNFGAVSKQQVYITGPYTHAVSLHICICVCEQKFNSFSNSHGLHLGSGLPCMRSEFAKMFEPCTFNSTNQWISIALLEKTYNAHLY